MSSTTIPIVPLNLPPPWIFHPRRDSCCVESMRNACVTGSIPRAEVAPILPASICNTMTRPLFGGRTKSPYAEIFDSLDYCYESLSILYDWFLGFKIELSTSLSEAVEKILLSVKYTRVAYFLVSDAVRSTELSPLSFTLHGITPMGTPSSRWSVQS